MLYNFKARHPDELDLKAGYKVNVWPSVFICGFCSLTHNAMRTARERYRKIQYIRIIQWEWVHQSLCECFILFHFSALLHQVTVIDTSDPDWWKGKCLGRIGYFPSKYCARLAGGEKPLQVTHNLQVSDNERPDTTMTLLRDQIVIQVRHGHGSMERSFW